MNLYYVTPEFVSYEQFTDNLDMHIVAQTPQEAIKLWKEQGEDDVDNIEDYNPLVFQLPGTYQGESRVLGYHTDLPLVYAP